MLNDRWVLLLSSRSHDTGNLLQFSHRDYGCVTASTTLSEPRNHKSKHRPTRENSLSRRLGVVQKKSAWKTLPCMLQIATAAFFVLLHSMETALNNTSSLEIHYCLDVPPHQRVVTCFTLCAADTYTYVPGDSHVRLADVCSHSLEPCMKGKSG